MLVGLLLLGGAALLPFWLMPHGNTERTRFDAILVLGHPAIGESTPDAEAAVRTLEAVHEYQKNIAPIIIVSGGRAHNQFLEAHAMARFAADQGVPQSAILEEDQARNTIENVYFTMQIMKAHHWHSMEVVSEPSHLPRAGFILEHFPVEWRTHASPWPASMGPIGISLRYCAEVAKLDLRMVGIPRSSYMHL